MPTQASNMRQQPFLLPLLQQLLLPARTSLLLLLLLRLSRSSSLGTLWMLILQLQLS
jgi:hypothetical protein